MRSLITALALLAFLGGPALADQDDPRLDPLFEKLRTTEDFEAAMSAERSIWSIWLEHDDPQIEEMMAVGTTAMNLGNLEDALAVFDQMVEVAPGYAEAWNKRATVLYALGDYEGSLADIEETLEREPRHFGALSGKGLCLAAQDKLEEALRAFEATLEVHPNSPGARTNIEALEQALEGRAI
jgi:tetratricopeptide (TPR) repeat protein